MIVRRSKRSESIIDEEDSDSKVVSSTDGVDSPPNISEVPSDVFADMLITACVLPKTPASVWPPLGSPPLVAPSPAFGLSVLDVIKATKAPTPSPLLASSPVNHDCDVTMRDAVIRSIKEVVDYKGGNRYVQEEELVKRVTNAATEFYEKYNNKPTTDNLTKIIICYIKLEGSDFDINRVYLLAVAINKFLKPVTFEACRMLSAAIIDKNFTSIQNYIDLYNPNTLRSPLIPVVKLAASSAGEILTIPSKNGSICK